MQKKLLIGNSANKHTTYLHDFFERHLVMRKKHIYH